MFFSKATAEANHLVAISSSKGLYTTEMDKVGRITNHYDIKRITLNKNTKNVVFSIPNYKLLHTAISIVHLIIIIFIKESTRPFLYALRLSINWVRLGLRSTLVIAYVLDTFKLWGRQKF